MGAGWTRRRGGGLFENSKELIVEILFGEGGQDSKLFVSDLATMYVKYGTSRGFQSEILSSDLGHCILKFVGNRVWHAFCHESGKHCVQRVPPTERSGRRQTSFISVAVLPLPPEGKEEPLREQDLEVVCQTGKQKAGGQHVNKTASAVRMKHKPTGLSVFINGRKQGQNYKEALRILTARVNQQRIEREFSAYSKDKREKLGNGGRGDKVRTYNFIRGDIVDHRLEKMTQNVKGFMKGDFGVLFSA